LESSDSDTAIKDEDFMKEFNPKEPEKLDEDIENFDKFTDEIKDCFTEQVEEIKTNFEKSVESIRHLF